MTKKTKKNMLDTGASPNHAEAREVGRIAGPRTMTKAEADAIADGCQDAFSFDAFGEQGWRSAARMLAAHELNAANIEAVLRSKYTRWAFDHAYGTLGKRRKLNGKDLERFMDLDGGSYWRDVESLTLETFGVRSFSD